MKALTVDIVGSTTGPCNLPDYVYLSEHIVSEEGYCLAVRVLAGKDVYNVLEGTDGAFHTLTKDTIFIGAVGGREALKGYRGEIPDEIAVGDVLSILNMGGILGVCTSTLPSLGEPIKVEVLGAVMNPHRDHKRGASQLACIQDYALQPVEKLGDSAPIVAICGTAMDTGKTKASAMIIEGLSKTGWKVGAAKLTGASLMRDVREMQARGAMAVGSFTDAGFVSSTGKSVVPHAKAVLKCLNEAAPDVIVVELGDGFIGPYGVDEFLSDEELTATTCADVVAATDLAGAWAASQMFASRYKRDITVMVGPVTDNSVGSDYIRDTLGIAAHNALLDGAGLVTVIDDKLKAFIEAEKARKPSASGEQQRVA